MVLPSSWTSEKSSVKVVRESLWFSPSNGPMAWLLLYTPRNISESVFRFQDSSSSSPNINLPQLIIESISPPTEAFRSSDVTFLPRTATRSVCAFSFDVFPTQPEYQVGRRTPIKIQYTSWSKNDSSSATSSSASISHSGNSLWLFLARISTQLTRLLSLQFRQQASMHIITMLKSRLSYCWWSIFSSSFSRQVNYRGTSHRHRIDSSMSTSVDSQAA
jgi:hypothetical protein